MQRSVIVFAFKSNGFLRIPERPWKYAPLAVEVRALSNGSTRRSHLCSGGKAEMGCRETLGGGGSFARREKGAVAGFAITIQLTLDLIEGSLMESQDIHATVSESTFQQGACRKRAPEMYENTIVSN